MQESGHYELLAEMSSHKDLKDRIGCVLHKRLELLAPNRKFCDLFSGMPPIPVIRFLPSARKPVLFARAPSEPMKIAMNGSNLNIKVVR
jgi:hypothetical protein